jgi:hypothetical protein
MMTLWKEFEEYRLEKTLIKSIKYKMEIIRADELEWKVINKVVKALVTGDEEEKEKLKYTKYRHLDLGNLKHIEVIRSRLEEIPTWLK